MNDTHSLRLPRKSSPALQGSVSLCTLFALTLTAAAGAQLGVELLPAEHADLAADALVAPLAAKAAPDVPREGVAVSWPLAGDEALESARALFMARSREYWVEVTAGELGRGVPVYTESPGALVRLNPVPEARDSGEAGLEKLGDFVDPKTLVVVDTEGRSWSDGSGMEQLVRPEQLARTGVPFPAGTSAFRLRADLGAGAFELRAEGFSGGRRYVVHVLDAASSLELTLRTGRTDYLHGQTLRIEASLARGARRFNLRKIDGFVTSPAGRAWPVAFHRARGGVYRATLELDALETPAPGLWEVHASAHGRVAGQPVLRGARTAFACAVPAATFNGDAELGAGEGLTVSLGVEVAAAGRYDVRGVLYGTAADGELRPAGVAQSAAWLEAGTGALELEFSRQVLESREVGAPFEVRDLRLADQGRMGVLHRQARGLVIE